MTPQSDLREAREAVVRRHAEAENAHDPDGVIASFHRPAYDVPALGPDGQANGEQAVRAFLGQMFQGFPDFHLELGKLHHADEAVFVEVTLSGTHQGEWAGLPPTGRSIAVRVGCLFEFEAQHLVVERVYVDMATILRQLGAL